MIFLIYGYFIFLEKSFIWESDGFTQHCLVFKEYTGLFRNFLQSPTNGFALWDWTIGLGEDVLTSYEYYAVGDPYISIWEYSFQKA